MTFYRKLHPGQPGTKRYLEKYGNRFVCVRYRYDSEKREKTKTIELIIERNAWQPGAPKTPPNTLMYLRIDFDETRLAKLVKESGGKWNKATKAWELPLAQVKALGLENRIITK